jgi:hypothetical protein
MTYSNTALLVLLWLLAGAWVFVRGVREAKLSGFRYPIYACLPLVAAAVAFAAGFALAPARMSASTLPFWVLLIGGAILPAIITTLAERSAQRAYPEQWEKWDKLRKNTSAIRAFFFYAGVRRAGP